MKISEALTGLGRPVVYYPSLLKIVDDLHAVILLCYLFFWKGKDNRVEKTAEEIETDTGLTYKMQMRARDVLDKLGFVASSYDRASHKTVFVVYAEKIDEAWESRENSEKEGGSAEAETEREEKHASDASAEAHDKKAYAEREDAQGASDQREDGILPKGRCDVGVLNELRYRENIHTMSAESAHGGVGESIPLSVDGRLTEWGVLGRGTATVSAKHSDGWPEDVRDYAQAWEADFLGRPATKGERAVIIKQIRELIARGCSLEEFRQAIGVGLADMREKGIRIARPMSIAYAIEAIRKSKGAGKAKEESPEEILRRWYGG